MFLLILIEKNVFLAIKKKEFKGESTLVHSARGEARPDEQGSAIVGTLFGLNLFVSH